MQREVFSILVIVACVMPVAALSTTLDAQYAPEETMIARIDGAFQNPLRAEQLELRRGHVPIPLEADVSQLGSATYFWGRAPRTLGNYTLVLKNAALIQGGVLQVINFTQNLSVSGDLVPYAVRPGFVNTDGDFALTIESYLDGKQKISISHPFPREILLVPGQTTHEISAASLPANSITSVQVGKYQVPVFIRGNVTISVRGQQQTWIVDPPRLRALLRVGEPLPSFTVMVAYRGTEELKNVALYYNASSVAVTPATFKSIKTNESITFNVSIKERGNTSRTEHIRFGSGDDTYILTLAIELPKLEERAKNVSVNESVPYCSQLSGIVCREKDICSTTPVTSKDGACCLGTCEQSKPKSRAWIGYLLFGIILLIGTIVWARYKHVKPKNPLDSVMVKRKHP